MIFKRQFLDIFGARKKEEFSRICGYSDLLDIINRAKTCETSYNLALIGPPASGKSLIAWEIRDQYGEKGAYYDGASTTGPGILLDLKEMEPKPRALIIDELDKMDRKEQKPLLNLFEGGEVIKTNVKNRFRFKIEGLKVFVTLNDIDALRPELRSRFRRIYLKEYTYDQFSDIAVKCLPRLKEETARHIAKRIWEGGDRDVRSVINTGALVQKKDGPLDIDEILNTFSKYGRQNE